MYGPTGIGVLYGKAELLEKMPPYQGGGEMISFVTFEKTEYNVIPYKFEAGTPAIVQAVGFGAAIDYLTNVGMEAIAIYENEILHYATEQLSQIMGLRLVGTAPHKTGIISFTLGNLHPHDIGTVLDRQGVAVRTGHHCAMPVMQHFGLAATVRASLGIYNTTADVDALVEALQVTKEFFAI
jgi:cysteine desulfurase/selenocysteine lyase